LLKKPALGKFFSFSGSLIHGKTRSTIKKKKTNKIQKDGDSALFHSFSGLPDFSSYNTAK
jgi:hypothetical protein